MKISLCEEVNMKYFEGGILILIKVIFEYGTIRFSAVPA